MSYGRGRTEHAGAKNGGGFWGCREDAKTHSKAARRIRDREEVIRNALEGAEMALEKRCPKCGAEKLPGVYHAHCSDCGRLVGSPHAPGCVQSWRPPRGAICPKCKKLLAAGAWCPIHGNPLENE